MAQRIVDVPDGEYCENCIFLKFCGSYVACQIDAEVLTKMKEGRIRKSRICPKKIIRKKLN
ncbi:MAG: hypothetical protein ABIA63_10605 [bacterium]